MRDTRYPRRMFVPVVLLVLGGAWLGAEIGAPHPTWLGVGFALAFIVTWALALKETIITHTIVNRVRTAKEVRYLDGGDAEKFLDAILTPEGR